MQERTKAINANKVIKVLTLNILLGGMILFSFKFKVFWIFNILIMPIYCKLFLEEKIFTNLSPIDIFTSTLFVISSPIGCAILCLLDIFNPFNRKK